MGTSQSSGGPGGGVPMVPPWTPAPPAGDTPADEGGQAEPSEPSAAPPTPQPVPLAPAGRFRGTRLKLGKYASSGDARDLRRSLKNYVRSGYGGSGTATRRFGGTAATAGALGSALASVASGRASVPGSPLDPILLAGRSVNEVMDAVVEAVRPVDGTQDAESERMAIRDSLSDLLTQFPDADILNLDADQRNFAIERFTAIDVYRRFDLDVGKTISEKAPSAMTALSRLKEVRDYIKEEVAASFRKLRDAGRALTSGLISRVVRDALLTTFQVFEGYSE